MTTESVTSLQTEKDESEITNNQGRMSTQTPKECPQLGTERDTQLSGEMGNRHFREETTSAKEDMRETENLAVRSRSVLPTNAQQEQRGTLTKPQRPRWGGGSTPHGSVLTSGHVRRAGASSKEGTRVEKCHRAGPHSFPISSHTS